MKHILPILTITTLAAAASAQTAAASSGLAYNRAGLSYGFDTKNYSLSASALIGSSNVLISAATTINTKAAPGVANGTDTATVGYVFKNLALGTDVTLSVGSNEVYGINLRRSLSEIAANLEGAIGYSRANTNPTHTSTWSAELAYNINKQYSVALGYSNSNAAGVAGQGQTSLTARYNF